MTVVEGVVAAETWPGLSQQLTIGKDVAMVVGVTDRRGGCGHGCWSD